MKMADEVRYLMEKSISQRDALQLKYIESEIVKAAAGGMRSIYVSDLTDTVEKKLRSFGYVVFKARVDLQHSPYFTFYVISWR